MQPTGKAVTLQFDGSNTIDMVKSKIQEEVGIILDQQNLVFDASVTCLSRKFDKIDKAARRGHQADPEKKEDENIAKDEQKNVLKEDCASKEDNNANDGQEIVPKKDSGAFLECHALNCCFWNTNKLSAIKKPEFAHKLADFAEFDVILLSEVPCKSGENLIKEFTKILNDKCAKENRQGWYEYHLSQPGSAKENKSTKLELHAALVRITEGIKVVATETLATVGESSIDYAPFAIHLRDERFAEDDCKNLTLVSVHMPPVSRKMAQDKQIPALLANYPMLHSHDAADRPFTLTGARKGANPLCTHVVGGDWNSYLANEAYGAERCGWEVALKHARATTVGGKPFDNVVVNCDALRGFTLAARVRGLSDPKNLRMGRNGLSDHDPVAITLEEIRSAPPGRPPAPPRGRH